MKKFLKNFDLAKGLVMSVFVVLGVIGAGLAMNHGKSKSTILADAHNGFDSGV